MMLPLYRRLLGQRFAQLPARVAELHDVAATCVWAGRADVERGRSLLSRMLASLFGLPTAGRDQTLQVVLDPIEGGEIWLRRFGSKVFRSVQYERAGLLRERVGLAVFVFGLDTSADGMALKLEDVRVLGLPLPRWLSPSVRTFESQREDRYHFDVEARLPLLGLIVRYAGWLERA
jgi:Domain of unknown function (DUF4166)